MLQKPIYPKINQGNCGGRLTQINTIPLSICQGTATIAQVFLKHCFKGICCSLKKHHTCTEPFMLPPAQ
uniref:Uncharacterized protein n=1 Tax=Anguilla anguilla TaxID=7936 RepID=A0A0E9T3W5_ANGAN